MDHFALKELMERLGTRQSAFAKLLGISQGQLSKVLGGKHSLRPKAAERASAIAKDKAPDLASRAGLLDEVAVACRTSDEFRRLLVSAMELMRKNA